MFSQILMSVKAIVVLLAAIHFFAALLRKEDADWIKGAPRTMFVGLYLIGMWGHFIGVAYLALILFVALLPRSRADAAALYVVALIALPDLFWKPVFGSLYLFPFTKYLFAAIGLAFALARHPKPVHHTASRFDLPVLIVVILEVAQARSDNATDFARLVTPILLDIALPYFLISRALNSAEDVRRFMLALALGGFVMGIVATLETHLHFLLYKQIEVGLHVTSQINAFQQMRGGMLRAPGSFPESTSLGNFLAIAGVAVIALRGSFATKRKWYIAVGVLLFSLLAPNSRGAFIGVGVGLLAFDFYRKRYGALIAKAGVAMGTYMAMLMAAQFSPYIAEMIGKGATESSTEYRRALLRRGWEEIQKHPALGTTMKTALDNLSDMRSGEGIIDIVNGYISYGLTLGYPGMVGLLLVFVSLLGSMLLVRRKLAANDVLSNAAAFVFSIATLMVLLAFFTTVGGEKSSYFYWVAALGSALYALRRSALADAGSSGTAALLPVSSGVRGMIEADRAAAGSRGRRLRGEMADRPGGGSFQGAG